MSQQVSEVPATPPGPAETPWADQLRDIQSITDAALSALEPQSLLDALVVRVKEALQADTAAVLLLDRPSGLLIATAASGLEEEVRQRDADHRRRHGQHVPRRARKADRQVAVRERTDPDARDILAKAKRLGREIVLPVDAVVAQKFAAHAPSRVVSVDQWVPPR